MIFTNANVFPWVVFGAALADDDITGNHRLAAELFDAQSASGGVASIAG
jgi:hypothetical protein